MSENTGEPKRQPMKRIDILRRKHIRVGLTPQEQKELADLNLRAVRERLTK